MSHVATIECEIKDLKALKSACNRLNLIWKEDQKTYKWFGRHVGDYPIPDGFTTNDLGKCDHAIGVPGCDYEIGVVKNKIDNGKTHKLLWDFWDKNLKTAMGGEKAPKLTQMITIEQSKLAARQKGYSVKELVMDDRIRLVVNMWGGE
jgi:hypothetical protein